MTERVFVSRSAGPVVLGLSLPVGSVRVQVDPDLPVARVVLSTDDASGPAAEAVGRARSRQDGQAFGIEVPEMPDNVMVQGTRGNVVFQSMGRVHGTVTGMTIVNGRIISGGGQDMPSVSPIIATVHLPAGSSLAVVSTSADAEVFGFVNRIEFRSVSGDLDADIVCALDASTTSGDINAGRVTEQITARSVSGDIDVALYNGRSADLTTTSGDVRVQATTKASGRVSARSVSGDIRISGGGHLNVSARSVSGRTRTH
ncbi:hypothetical protein HY68_12870 [Streptomyces sp. AcH 505]|uniref:DUF4097 family beta strand repeat-containing protein n=1 Tax=Streptomyces sp. AcH 505 TaxID=352211 RepID=UPI000591957A|nr:hypothetical protein HY68_12870 [Streptomyces sp. AcH 505]